MSWIDNLDETVSSLKETIKTCNLEISGWRTDEKINSDSYYKDYKDCKHYKSESITLFDFDSPMEFKQILDELWIDTKYEPLKRIYIKLMLQSRDIEDNMLPVVDVHNYMM